MSGSNTKLTPEAVQESQCATQNQTDAAATLRSLAASHLADQEQPKMARHRGPDESIFRRSAERRKRSTRRRAIGLPVSQLVHTRFVPSRLVCSLTGCLAPAFL